MIEEIPIGKRLFERTVRGEVVMQIDSLRSKLDEIESLLRELVARLCEILNQQKGGN